MGVLIKRIFLYIYSWSFKSILICTILSVISCTLLSLLASKKISKAIYFIMFAASTIAIVFFTITNRSSSAEHTARLIPFASFKNAGYGAYQSMWLNAFFFLPLGLSLPYLLPEKIKRKVLSTILISAAFSLCIEAVQFIFKLGLCETDDVIINTLGAAIGTLSYIFAHVNSTRD